MSVFGTNERARELSRARRVAALHETEQAWSLVLCETDAAVLPASPESVRVIEAARLGAGDREGVKRVLAKHRVERLVRVLGAGQAIVRTVELPEGSLEELTEAVELIAEAQLPATLPPHRRSAGLSSLPSGGEGRLALLTGWVGESPTTVLDGDEQDESFVAQAVALAGLANVATRPPDEPAVIVGVEPGAVCVIASGVFGTRVRAGRVAGSYEDAIAETLPPEIEPPRVDLSDSAGGGRGVFIDERTREALMRMAPTSGVDREWVRTHAAAAGAAIGLLTSGEHAARLYALLAEPPKIRLSPGERVALWLGEPKRAGVLLGLALLVLILGPLAINFARYSVLEKKLSAIRATVGDEESAAAQRLERDAIFLEGLRERRIPVTSLLAAIAESMPVGADTENPLGVQAEEIRIDDGSVLIEGRASDAQVVERFADRLKATGLFDEAVPQFSTDRATDEVEFTVNATLEDPLPDAPALGAFVEETFAVRLHGDEARTFDYASLETLGPTLEDRARSSRTTRPASGSDSRGARFTGGEGDNEEEGPPAALSDQQIDELNEDEARAEFATRLRASRLANIDDETKRRLNEEVSKLRRRLEELRE